MCHRKGLAVDGWINSGQTNIFILKEWLYLAQPFKQKLLQLVL